MARGVGYDIMLFLAYASLPNGVPEQRVGALLSPHSRSVTPIAIRLLHFVDNNYFVLANDGYRSEFFHEVAGDLKHHDITI